MVAWPQPGSAMASRANTNRIIDEVGRSIELVRGEAGRPVGRVAAAIVSCGEDSTARTRTDPA